MNRKKIKYIFYFVALILLISGCTEKPISESQAESFMKYYGLGFEDGGQKVIQLSDGGYAVLTTVETRDKGGEICLLITNRYGDLIQPMKLYGGENDDYAIDFEFDGSSFVIAGNTQQSSTNTDIRLLKTDQYGDLQWIKQYGGTKNDVVSDIIIDSDSKIVLTGYTDSITAQGDYKKQILFFKSNQDGSIDGNWTMTGFNNDEIGNSVTETATGYLVAGSTNSNFDNSDTKHIYLLKFSRLGIVGTPRKIQLDSESEAISISRLSDSEFIIGCNKLISNNSSTAYILSVNPGTLATNWSAEYEYGDINEVSQVLTYSNRIYTLISSTTDSYGNTVILSTDTEGGNEGLCPFGEGTELIGGGFDQTSDGGFIITGTNRTGDNSIIYLLKLNFLLGLN